MKDLIDSDEIVTWKETMVVLEHSLERFIEFWKAYYSIPLIKSTSRSPIQVQKTFRDIWGFQWHTDGIPDTDHRKWAVIWYLNTVERGGETYFCYQKKKMKPKRGSIIFFPCTFNYIHSGLPPVTEDKYIATCFLYSKINQ